MEQQWKETIGKLLINDVFICNLWYNIKPERFKVAYWDKQDNKKQRFKSLKDLNVERVSHDI